MKQIKVKRLVYTNYKGARMIGGVEYNGSLTNENILYSIHEIGKTAWIGNELWLLRNNSPEFRITVELFYQYQKSWYDKVLDAFRRI